MAYLPFLRLAGSTIPANLHSVQHEPPPRGELRDGSLRIGYTYTRWGIISTRKLPRTATFSAESFPWNPQLKPASQRNSLPALHANFPNSWAVHVSKLPFHLLCSAGYPGHPVFVGLSGTNHYRWTGSINKSTKRCIVVVSTIALAQKALLHRMTASDMKNLSIRSRVSTGDAWIPTARALGKSLRGETTWRII